MGLNRVQSALDPELESLIQQVIGAAIEVHRHLGPGFLESIYGRALCYELKVRNIPFVCEQAITVQYKEIEIPGQRLDLVVADKLVLELKSVDTIHPIHKAQLISCLRTTQLRAGLIINFKVQVLKDGIQRIVL